MLTSQMLSYLRTKNAFITIMSLFGIDALRRIPSFSAFSHFYIFQNNVKIGISFIAHEDGIIMMFDEGGC